MNKLHQYKLTTGLYAAVGFIFAITFIFSAFQQRLIPMIITFAGDYVSFDNVICKDRKKRYMQHAE